MISPSTTAQEKALSQRQDIVTHYGPTHIASSVLMTIPSQIQIQLMLKKKRKSKGQLNIKWLNNYIYHYTLIYFDSKLLIVNCPNYYLREEQFTYSYSFSV